MSLGSIHNAEQALGQAEEREGPGGDMIDRPGISILQEFLPLALWLAQNVLPSFSQAYHLPLQTSQRQEH